MSLIPSPEKALGGWQREQHGADWGGVGNNQPATCLLLVVAMNYGSLEAITRKEAAHPLRAELCNLLPCLQPRKPLQVAFSLHLQPNWTGGLVRRGQGLCLR